MFFNVAVQGSPWGFYWLGAEDMHRNGTFEWLDGTPLLTNITPWANDQPDDSQGSEYCIAYSLTLFNGVGDAPCQFFPMPFMCEI